MSREIPIRLLMDVTVFMGHTAYCNRWLYRVGAGSGPGVALFADMAVQSLIQVLTGLSKCIACQFSHAFSAHAYEWRAPNCMFSLIMMENHERLRLGLHADDMQSDFEL